MTDALRSALVAIAAALTAAPPTTDWEELHTDIVAVVRPLVDYPNTVAGAIVRYLASATAAATEEG